jgi:hypothetical protein
MEQFLAWPVSCFCVIADAAPLVSELRINLHDASAAPFAKRFNLFDQRLRHHNL